MASIEEVVFIISFIGLMGVMVYKIVNALNNYELYDFPTMIILFILGVLSFGLGLSMSILSYESLAITQLQKFAVLPLLVMVIITIIEAFFLIQKATQPRQAYRPENVRRN